MHELFDQVTLQVHLGLCIFTVIEIKKLFGNYRVCEVTEVHAFLNFLHLKIAQFCFGELLHQDQLLLKQK
jgi:hypothetical protein